MKDTTYIKLYRKLRDDILSGVYPYGAKLPSKRTLAADHGVSLVTVEHAIEILCEEGYAVAAQRSGYFASYQESDGFAAAAETGNPSAEKTSGSVYERSTQSTWESSGSEGVSAEVQAAGSAALFPFSVYAKTMRRVLSEYGERLLIKSPNAGCEELRTALCGYLARSRGLKVSRAQIIIGAGAEYLYGLAVQILGRDKIYGIEKPSYEKIEQVYEANDVTLRLLSLGENGILSRELKETDAGILHITPYRSFPSGVTADAGKRREYIRWADSVPGRFIIEDDFDSEFTPLKKPEDTVFSLSGKENVIYINTFTRTIAPSMRIGYMVLPPALLPTYEKQAGFYSCAVPTVDQITLSEFITDGSFERHINRVRRIRRKEKIQVLPMESTCVRKH